MELNETEVSHKEAELSREILKFLKDGEDALELNRFNNVALVLGFTGSGKSTLSQFITDNDQGLIAKEVGVDTGEYTVLDLNNNVCNGTIDSCTIIPKLYVDRETNSGFYDCPGFGDNRSIKHDISVTYLIKKVIDSAESVKLLFTVSYPSVRQGVDRQSFMQLVKNALNMVKNIEKYKNSIALVVTKVDNQYMVKKGKAVLVPDRTIILNIADFLRTAQDSLRAKLVSEPTEQNFLNNAIKFVEILLEKEGDNFKRIGLFRRPDNDGKLSGSELLKLGKANLKKILHENIRFEQKKAEDFGYTLSADSLNHMHALIFQINEDLAVNFRALSFLIQAHYYQQEGSMNDLEELQRVIAYGHEFMLNIKYARNYTTPIELMNEMNNLAKTNNVNIPNEINMNVVHYDYFLNFLNSISGLKSSSLQWLQGLNEVINNLSRVRTWIDLMVDLQSTLSQYSVLKEIRSNHTEVNRLKEMIRIFEGSESLQSLFASLEKFLQQVFKHRFESRREKIRSLQVINVEEWKLLGKLLDFEVNYICEPSTVILTGQYITLSDVDKSNCLRQSTKLLAWKKVFIDKNFVRRSSNELVIMGPTWEVIGSPEIVLNGEDGQDIYPRKASDGWYYGFNGDQGKEGGKGGEGGLFWGLGQTCINCHHLSISANGGRGGSGQDGGDGRDGQDFYHSHHGEEHGKMILLVYNTDFEDNILYGQRGGDGGRGGNGGVGGPSGKVVLKIFGAGERPSLSTIQGSPGRRGAGGSPGDGGRSKEVIVRTRAILFIPWQRNETRTLHSASSGSWGSSGQSPTWTYPSTRRFSSPKETLAGYLRNLTIKTNTLTDANLRLFIKNLESTNVINLEHFVGRRSADEIKLSTTPVHDSEYDDAYYGQSSTFEHNQSSDDATNSASMKSSLLNYAFLLINLIVKPFWKTQNNLKHNVPENLDLKWEPSCNYFSVEHQKNYQDLFAVTEITDQSSNPIAVDSSKTLCVPSSLLLLDYLVRMKYGTERHCRRKSRSSEMDNNGHQMAYSAQIPTLCSPPAKRP